VVLAILRALAAVVRRDLAGYSPIRTNNFFLFIVLLIAGAFSTGVEPVSSYPFLVLLAVLLFFPISSDPLEKIPRVRMGLWPLTRRNRLMLRLAGLALSPVLWFAVVLLIRQGRRVVLPLGAVAGAAVARTWAPGLAPRFALGRVAPPLPGPAGILIRNRLRAMLALLDTWLAAVIAVIAIGWRVTTSEGDSAAWPILAILVGIALSTQAQCGADLEATRYRLLPAIPWRILLARDCAYLLVQLVLTVGLDPLAGLAFGMTALAVGRYPTLHAHLSAERWRFASGRVFFGALQMIIGAGLAFAGAKGAAIAAVIWAGSLWWGGSVLAQRLRGIDARGAPRR
jgi:hypothetical protein